MSDTINVLNQIVGKCSERGGDNVNPEDLSDHRLKLLELIVEIAGDCLEEHKAASLRAKPRKQRVYKEIVKQIAAYFCDICDTQEDAFARVEGIQAVLGSFNIETQDYKGRPVKI